LFDYRKRFALRVSSVAGRDLMTFPLTQVGIEPPI
jgi:hypothetical protein